MKRSHWFAIIVVAAMIAIGIFWLPPRTKTFATPEECIQAFYTSAKDADTTAYLRCLDETLRTQVEKRYPESAQLRKYLKTSMENVMNWVQLGDAKMDGAKATISMEETRKQANQQVRIGYELVKSNGSWRITAMEAPRNVPTVLPYGIHEKELLAK